MKIKMLAGAAAAALMGLAAPAIGATSSYTQPSAVTFGTEIDAFYARRPGTLLWLSSGPTAPDAVELINVLRRAPLDGMASGPAIAAQASSLLRAAQAGDQRAAAQADRFLSAAWVQYVQTLQRPPSGMAIADGWAAPRRQSASEILLRAASARSLIHHVRSVSNVNPIYAQIRNAAWQEAQANGGAIDARVLANLDRVRAMPFQDRYIVVDAASAKLWMVEGGRIADSMKVIVGKPTSQTPMLASTIYYATVNPYWNVPQDLVQKLIAPRVLDQGTSYLKSHSYEVLSDYSPDATPLAADAVDWRAVAAGQTVVKVRQLPGPANSMGQVKFGFPNSDDIFLHDTPRKELFAQANRDVSNGCIRLEDAQRLERWLLGKDVQPSGSKPEQHIALPKPVPIYVTYLTAQADDGELTYLDDAYGRDSGVSKVTALR